MAGEISLAVYTVEQLASKDPAHSGAKRIGLAAVEGLAAQDVQAAIAALDTEKVATTDSRLTDARTPTDGSVSLPKVATDVLLPFRCTSTTRPASPKTGQLIYETDTFNLMKNVGTPAAPDWRNVDTTGGGGSQVPERAYSAPAFTDFSQAITSQTWTRLGNPAISVPAPPAAPSGMAWRVDVSGHLMIDYASNVVVYLGANIDNGPMGAIHGGRYHTGSAHPQPASLDARGLVPPAGAFTVNLAFYHQGGPAGTYTFRSGPQISTRLYLVPA